MIKSKKQKYVLNGTDFNVGVRYTPQEYLGAGSFGCVISALDHLTKRLVAIKKLHKLDDLIDGKRILREVRLMRVLINENLLELLDIIYH